MKARKVLLWVVGVPLALYAVAYAALFRTTKPIEGVLVDAKTGKPVSKALVHANWFFTYPGLVDTSSGGFGHGTVTDENGKFRIPRKNATIVFGRFVDQGLMVKHPLYEFLEVAVYAPWDKGKEYRVGKIDGGVLKVTLPIMSLEDKFSRAEDKDKFGDIVGSCGPDFYATMRDRFNIRYDIDAIMAKLEELSRRYSKDKPEDTYAYRAFKTHEFYMSKFRKTY